MLTSDNKNGRFLSILSDGKLHETVPQGTEDAVLREYETSDGKKGEKWERVFTKVEAQIVNVAFRDGDYGEQVQITFSDKDGNQVIISQGVATNFGEDILKKLPSIDFSKDVTLKPYSFTDEDTGKPKRGVTFYQDGDKVLNYFWDEDAKKTVHGFPTPDGDIQKYDKDDWKIHFLRVRKFLIAFTKENIVPKFANYVSPSGVVGSDFDATSLEGEADINPEDIPF